MEITFDRSRMLKAVNTAKSFAEGSSAVKVLQGTFLSARGRQGPSDDDRPRRCGARSNWMPALPRRGPSRFPCKTLGTVLKALPHSRVSLRKEADDAIAWRPGLPKSVWRVVDVEEYPDINPPCERLAAMPLPASLVNKVAYAVSHDETRYTLNGVHVEAGAAGLKAGGHRRPPAGALPRPLASSGKRPGRRR